MSIAFPTPSGKPTGPPIPVDQGRSHSARRASAPLPPEIGFLAGCGVAPQVLVEAMETARLTSVTPDVALLASGAVSEAMFYRTLARRLGAVYLPNAIAVAPVSSAAETIAAGIARAVPNVYGIRFVIAPRGRTIAKLLDARRSSGAAAFTIAAPRAFAAAVREAQASKIAADAVRECVVDGCNLSARRGPTWLQAALLSALNGVVCFGAVATPAMACFVASIPILLAILVRLAATDAGARPRRVAATRRTRDAELPVYTILVPLYREARVAEKLVRSLDRLDYPYARLDIKLLVEAEDRETRDALTALELPTRYEILTAPPGHPRTKPRALNIGLAMARGDLLVVYDAEDEPDPDQLRAAARRFDNAPESLACLQAKLAIHNMADGWLPRLFAIDYGALFDAVNPGLAALRLPILLGGTSNHFRTRALRDIGGWDAWNVTEDADLGIRIARCGYDVEVLDSSTFEEAPDRLTAWLKQRSRWYKGWMQTLGVHARAPWRTIQDLGFVHAALCFASLVSGLASALLGPALTVVAIVQVTNGNLLRPASDLDAIVCVTACLVFALGVVALVWPAILAIARRRRWALLPMLALLPVYCVLLMLAAWMALLDLAWKPHRWLKTEHGLGKHGSARIGSRRQVRSSPAPTSPAQPAAGWPPSATGCSRSPDGSPS